MLRLDLTPALSSAERENGRQVSGIWSPLDWLNEFPPNKMRAMAVPSPWGRIALLAFAQRLINVSRTHIPTNRHPRKRFPSVPKTLGDHIHIKRYEKHLTLAQVALYMGIATKKVKSFESDRKIPNEREWQSLQRILGFDPGLMPERPNSGVDVGNFHLSTTEPL